MFYSSRRQRVATLAMVLFGIGLKPNQCLTEYDLSDVLRDNHSDRFGGEDTLEKKLGRGWIRLIQLTDSPSPASVSVYGWFY